MTVEQHIRLAQIKVHFAGHEASFSFIGFSKGSQNQPFFQAIEGLVEGLIVPLVGDQLVGVVDDGESVDQVGAQEGVHVAGQESSCSRSVLGPVGEVAHHLGRGHCRTENIRCFNFHYVVAFLHKQSSKVKVL